MVPMKNGQLLAVGRLDLSEPTPHVSIPNFRFEVAVGSRGKIVGLENGDAVLVICGPPGRVIQQVEVVTLGEVAVLLDQTRAAGA